MGHGQESIPLQITQVVGIGIGRGDLGRLERSTWIHCTVLESRGPWGLDLCGSWRGLPGTKVWMEWGGLRNCGLRRWRGGSLGGSGSCRHFVPFRWKVDQKVWNMKDTANVVTEEQEQEAVEEEEEEEEDERVETLQNNTGTAAAACLSCKGRGWRILTMIVLVGLGIIPLHLESDDCNSPTKRNSGTPSFRSLSLFLNGHGTANYRDEYSLWSAIPPSLTALLLWTRVVRVIVVLVMMMIIIIMVLFLILIIEFLHLKRDTKRKGNRWRRRHTPFYFLPSSPSLFTRPVWGLIGPRSTSHVPGGETTRGRSRVEKRDHEEQQTPTSSSAILATNGTGNPLV